MRDDAPNITSLTSPTKIDPAVYGNSDLFESEMREIFDRAWLLVGHESQIPDPGDFVLERAGRHPIILWRDPNGFIRGFLNRCPHRGARLCNRPHGRAKAFTCPYHGWVFDGTGALKSVPAPNEYGPEFDFADWGLTEVAALESYRGFLFVRHTSEGPDLGSFLGAMSSSFDDLVDRAPDGDIEICPVPLRHRYNGNWKLCLENLNDAHHARVAHNCAVKAAGRVMRKLGDRTPHPSLQIMMANGMPVKQFGQLRMSTSDYGHSFIHGFIDGQDATSRFPAEYVDAMKTGHGETETERILSVDRHLTLIYPGATLQGRFQVMRLIQPLGPNLTEIVGFLFRLKGAPQAMFEQSLHYFHISMSPFSPVATDDFDLYDGTQKLNGSALAGTLPVMRGLNGAPESAGDGHHQATSEAFIRNQYATWQKYMNKDAGTV